MDDSGRGTVPEPNPVWAAPPGPGGVGSGVPGPAALSGAPDAVGPGYGPDLDPAPYPVVATKPKRSSSTLLNVVLGLAVVVFIGGVAFAAGRLTAPATAATTGFGAGTGFGNGAGFGNGPRASGAPGNFRGTGAGFAGGTLRGTVTAVSSTGITLTVGQTGATIQIPTDASTTYHKQAAGAATDITPGATVLVELNQTAGQGFGGGGFGGGGAGASPAPGASARTFTLGTATDVTVVGK
jgi:hypothetical protein